MKQAPLNHPSQNTQLRPFDVVALAASAGNHAAITTILRDLPAAFSVPVIVMMPVRAETTETPEWLGRHVPFTVEWVKPDASLVPGRVLVCPPKSSVELLPDGTFRMTPNEQGALDRPIDRLLESIAHSFGERAIGVVLTSMQSDGVLGAHQLHRAGGTVIVQSENSTEFPNMPRAAIQSGAAEVVLPLNKIASFLVGLVVDDLIPRSPTELEAADFGAFDYSPQTGKLVWDRQMKRLWGLEPDEELNFEHAIERIHAEDRARVGQVVAAALSPAGDGDFQVEFRVVWPDGTVHWHAGKGRVYFEQGPDGKRSPVRLTGVESDITERKQTEDALHKSEEKYRTLFNSMDEGFCIVEVLFDHNEKPLDYRFLEVNPSFEKHTGIRNGAGKTMREIAPEHEENWFEIYGRVALTGEPVRFENRAGQLQRWYDVYAFRVDNPRLRRVAILFKDITERKQVEEALRESEERQAFLLQLSDALRPLRDPVAIQAEATRVLGEHLGVSRVMYGEVSEDGVDLIVEQNYVADEAPVLTGRFRMTDFGPALVARLNAGRTVVLPEIASAGELSSAEREAYAALGIASLAGVPLTKGGRFVANLNVHHSAPRAWTANELRLIEETAERTWAAVERARTEKALRESEEKYKTLFNSIDDSFELLEINRDQNGKPRDVRVLEVNPAYERQSGQKAEQVIGQKWSKIEPSVEPYWNEKVFRVADTGQPERYEDYNRERGKIFDVYFFRFAQDRVGALFRDITEHKQAEEALRASEEKYRTLFETMEEGFAVTELIRDENKRAVDLRYLALNPRFEALTGLARADIIGRLRSEVVGVDNWWLPVYQTVMDTGEKVRVEHYAPEHQRWFDVTIFPYGGNLFANIFDDITDRKRAEEALREHQKQLQFLNEMLEQKVQEKTAEVRQLASDLIKATQRERQRISHVLHDDLQQRIYAIQMQLSFLQDGLQSESLQKEGSDIAKGLTDILKITRHLSIDLSPPILRDEGLAHAVGWLAARMQQQYGLPVELQVNGPFVIPNEDLHVLLFNSVRELLFNIVKHAQASRAWVTLQRSQDAIQIEVRDDGRGFSVNVLKKQKKENGLPPSLGLPTIRHQLSLFDGSMKINSEPDNGTQVTLSVPLAQAG